MKTAARVLTPVRSPAPPDRQLEVNVVYTGLPGSAKILRVASGLAHGLGARVTVHVAQVIPYPLPLKSPPVAVPFAEEKLRCLADEQSVETRIQMYLCRDLNETIRKVLKPDSVVLMGGRNRWWPTRERALFRALRRDGHRVIMIPPDRGQHREQRARTASTHAAH